MMERTIEKLLFASRWILAPVYLGMSLALVALGIKFFMELYHLLATVFTTSEADQSYKLTYLRDGKPQETTVTPALADRVARTLMPRESEPQAPAEEKKDEVQGTAIEGFGFAVSPLTDELAEEHGWQDIKGVVVTEVDPDGPAAASGMEVGMRHGFLVMDQILAELTQEA